MGRPRQAQAGCLRDLPRAALASWQERLGRQLPLYPSDSQNAFLTVTQIGNTAVTNMRRGYIINSTSDPKEILNDWTEEIKIK